MNKDQDGHQKTFEKKTKKNNGKNGKNGTSFIKNGKERKERNVLLKRMDAQP